MVSASDILQNVPLQFDSEATRLWQRMAPVAVRLQKRTTGRPSVDWTVSNSGALANYVGDGDDVSASELGGDDRLHLSLNRAIVRGGFALTHREIAIAKNARNASTLITDLVLERFLEGQSMMALTLEQGIFNGTGTAISPLGPSVTGIFGLITTALATSGTYAGQNIASVSGLQCNVQTTVGTLARSHLDKALAAIRTKSGRKPQFFMGSANMGVAFQNAISTDSSGNSLQRSMIVSDRPADYRFGQPMAPEIDVPSRWYDGIPFLENSAWGDGYIVAGSWDDLALDVLPYSDVQDPNNFQAGGLVSSNGSVVEQTGLPLYSYHLAKTGSTFKVAMEIDVQCYVKRPNAMALLRGITGTF